MPRRFHFLSALAGGLIAALAVSALPAIAQDAEPQAAPGSPFLLGQTNTVQANTGLRGTSASNLVIRNTGNGVPLNLVTANNGKPPMKVDSRRLVRNLNADKLDFRDANELIRAAFELTDDPPAPGPPQGTAFVATATITAPRPGILVFGGSSDAVKDGSAYACGLLVNSEVVTGSIRWSNAACSSDGALIVASGTHTVTFGIDLASGADVSQASVWVIWVPFDGNGTVPSPADNPTPSPDPAALDKRPDETD